MKIFHVKNRENAGRGKPQAKSVLGVKFSGKQLQNNVPFCTNIRVKSSLQTSTTYLFINILLLISLCLSQYFYLICFLVLRQSLCQCHILTRSIAPLPSPLSQDQQRNIPILINFAKEVDNRTFTIFWDKHLFKGHLGFKNYIYLEYRVTLLSCIPCKVWV